MQGRKSLSVGRRACGAGALLFFFVVATAFGEELTTALTVAEVECDELQLQRLESRFVVIENSLGANPSLFLWRSSPAGGVYSGLAVTAGLFTDLQGHRFRDEEQLAFDLFARQYSELLNPHRLVVPQATLARRSQDTTLVAPDAPPFLTVSMDLAQAVPDPYVPGVPLVINNLSRAGQGMVPFVAADAVGRGVTADNLATACHDKLTPFDQKIFGIIARTLRISDKFTDPDVAQNLTIFRGADPHTYEADLYLYQRTCDNPPQCEYLQFSKVALEFVVNWDEIGKLTAGEVRVLPLCPDGQVSHCSEYDTAQVAIYVFPPLWAGHARQGEAVFGLPHLDVEYPGSPDNVLQAGVDWQSLLAGASTWN